MSVYSFENHYSGTLSVENRWVMLVELINLSSEKSGMAGLVNQEMLMFMYP